MILSRRQAHLYIFSTLAVLLPLTFIVGMILRPQYRALNEDAQPLVEAANFAVDIDPAQSVEPTTLKGRGLSMDVAAVVDKGDRAWLYVKPRQIIKQPDLLLYWQPGTEAPEAIEADAILLGALSGNARRQFALPDAMQGEEGLLVVYSHGGSRIISTLELPSTLTED